MLHNLFRWGSRVCHRVRLGDTPTIVRVIALWPFAALLKHVAGPPRLARFFQSTPRATTTDPTRAAWIVDGVMRRAYRQRPGYCLERSLVLFHLLTRYGLSAQLCLGIRKGRSNGLSGHAWVEVDSHPVAEPRDPRTIYATTFAYPTSSL